MGDDYFAFPLSGLKSVVDWKDAGKHTHVIAGLENLILWTHETNVVPIVNHVLLAIYSVSAGLHHPATFHVALLIENLQASSRGRWISVLFNDR